MILLRGSGRCAGEQDDRLQLSWGKLKLSQLLHGVLAKPGCTPGLDYLFAAPAVWHRYCFPANTVGVRVNYRWKFQLPKSAASDFAKQDDELPLPDGIAYGFFKGFSISPC